MSFSFDGIYNDTTRGNEGKILSNIKKYNDKYNTKTGIILMINKYNYNNLLEEYKYLASLDLFSGV
jgi:sulfatase maturation enzyme AslB (radical SAM superfamily)